MKVTAFIRPEKLRAHEPKPTSIYVRLRDTVYDYDFKAVTKLKIIPDNWSDENQGYKRKISLIPMIDQIKLNIAVRDLKSLIESEYNSKTATQQWLKETIYKFHHKDDVEIVEESAQDNKQAAISIDQAFNSYIENNKVSVRRKERYNNLKRCLDRFLLFQIITKGYNSDYKFIINDITTDFLNQFWEYLKDEYIYIKKCPEILELLPERRRPTKARGHNTLVALFNVLRAFLHWCENNNIPTSSPFSNYKIHDEVYGTPYFLTIEERDKIFDLDLSGNQSLAIQRDIFIFQCLIGCRISDLYNLTKNNLVNNGIEYIAEKTKDKNPHTIRVPLNQKAQQILNRYKENLACNKKLFPFISQQNYNYAIKKILTVAGLTRNVPIIDSQTGETILKPLNEIASSHIARRTFIGNLYKQVKDPNLVGALSGHVEGSKAFARYRTIDEDMKKELVNLIN